MCAKLGRRRSIDQEDCPAVVKRRKLSANQRFAKRIKLEDLNSDVIRCILVFVHPLDLLALSKVNKALRSIISDPAVWWSVYRQMTEPSATNSYVDPLVDWRALCITHACDLQSVEATATKLPVLFPPSSYERYGSDIFQRATKLGLLLTDGGLLEPAEKLLTVVLDNAKTKYGEVHERTADATYDLAFVRGHMGKNSGEDGSRQLIKNVIVIYKEICGEKPTAKLASTIARLGDYYYLDGQYNDAEAQVMEAIHIRETCFPDDKEAMCDSFCSLAHVHFARDQYIQAEELFLKALSIVVPLHGKEHPEVARILLNLGVLAAVQGQFDKALSFVSRVLQIRKKSLGSHHPLTQAVVKVMAQVQAEIKGKQSAQKTSNQEAIEPAVQETVAE
eukprot:Colp12_sorted_trinity150504_noHs@25010